MRLNTQPGLSEAGSSGGFLTHTHTHASLSFCHSLHYPTFLSPGGMPIFTFWKKGKKCKSFSVIEIHDKVQTVCFFLLSLLEPRVPEKVKWRSVSEVSWSPSGVSWLRGCCGLQRTWIWPQNLRQAVRWQALADNRSRWPFGHAPAFFCCLQQDRLSKSVYMSLVQGLVLFTYSSNKICLFFWPSVSEPLPIPIRLQISRKFCSYK